MTPRTILRMLRQRWLWLLVGPVVAAALVLFATRNTIDTYASESILYTGLVSGYTIESAADNRVDYHAVTNAFDNLVSLVKARTTVEEAALRLLARQLVTNPSRLRVFDAEHAPEIVTLVEGIRGETRMLERLRAAKHRPESAVYEVLFKGNSPFAVDEIQDNLSVSRVASSDLLRMHYVGIDPLLCQWTLEVLLDVVTARHQTMKTRETGNVVAFFEQEVADARAALSERIEALRAFGVDNRVINYDEQTKAIAGQKETIEAQLQTERQRQAAAEAVLSELEARMVQQQALAVRSDSVLTLRDRLAEVTTTLALAEGAGTPRPDLRHVADSLEAALTAQVSALYDLSTSREGLNRENIAATWLAKLLEATDARAQVTLLERRLTDYGRYYDEFSPLGATLTTLEREVNTAEQTYLELLNSLNMARMREQNVQMAAGLDVVDAPFFPEDPRDSNRMMLAAGALVGCFGLLLTLFVLIEVVHPAIRSIERARSITKLTVATAYPPLTPTPPRLRDRLRPRLAWQGLPRKTDPLEDPVSDTPSPGAPTSPGEQDLHSILRVLDLHLSRAVKLHLLDRANSTPDGEGAGPLQIAVVSFLPDDGVTLAATRLAMLLREDYERVRHVAFATSPSSDERSLDERQADEALLEPAALLSAGFASDVDREVLTGARAPEPWSPAASPSNSRPSASKRKRKRSKTAAGSSAQTRSKASTSGLVVMELPPIVEQSAPLHLVRDADLAIVVLRANRVWTDADMHALDALKQAHARPMLLVLTQTHRDFLNGLTARGLPIPPFLRPVFG